MTRAKPEEVLRFYRRGHTTGEICVLTGNTQTQVRRVLRKHDLEPITVETRGTTQLNGIGLVCRYPAAPRITPEQRQAIQELATEGLPGTEVASLVPVSVNTVRRHRGVPALTRQELGTIALLKQRMEALSTT